MIKMHKSTEFSIEKQVELTNLNIPIESIIESRQGKSQRSTKLHLIQLNFQI